MGEYKMTVPGGLGTSAQILQFVPRPNPSRDLALITPLDVWDYNALLFETANDWLWDFCRAGYPNEPAVILSMDEKEPA